MSNKCPYCDAPGGTAVSCSSCQHHLKTTGSSGGSSSSQGGCFPKGTMITTPYGQVDIISLRAGDLVMSFNRMTGTFSSNSIIKVQTYSRRKLWKIILDNGESISTTASHSFSVDGRWVPAKSIRAGDKLQYRVNNGHLHIKTVIQSLQCEDIDDVYNLIVENNYSYIAEGAICHSFTFFRPLRCMFYKIRSLTSIAKRVMPDVAYHY